MEWEPKIKQLYENMVLKIPEMVRPVVKSTLLEAAEKKCEERNGKIVAEMDLIVALFEVTPPAFQPIMIQDLDALNVDYNLYLPKVSSGFKCNTDLNQMVKDILKLGEITGVKCNEKKIWKVLNTYSKFFIGSPVSMRTTTKPVENRDIAIRYVEMMMPHNPDPYTTAINKGLINNEGHPIHELILEAQDTFDIMGYGVDLDARCGLSKIWPFIIPGSIKPLFSMKSIPPSMKNYEDFFLRHNLTAFSLFAFDFSHKTMNIYFMLQKPSKASYKNCKSLIEDLGFKLPSSELIERCCDAVHLNFTFSWESDKIERLCFGMACNDYNEVPVHLNPLLREFVEKTPLQSEKCKFIWGVTFTDNGLYYKIENDYNGTMVDFLLLGCKAGLESYI